MTKYQDVASFQMIHLLLFLFYLDTSFLCSENVSALRQLVWKESQAWVNLSA